MLTHVAQKPWLLILAAFGFGANAPGADDAPWKDKPISKWTREDAKAVLGDSPWVKMVQLQIVRDLSPDERRASGDLQADRGKGVGIEGTGLFGPTIARAAIERAHAKPDPGKVVVRWEARAVRSAAAKLGIPEGFAERDSDYYRIVVYGVVTPKRWNIESELRGIAALKRYQQKDLKPARVVMMRKDDETADVMYLFRRSVEITKKDSYAAFWAQIGRLVIWQVFTPGEMLIQNELEL